MHTLIKKGLSLFFALTLLFSPLAAPLVAPKAEAQIGGAIAGCLAGFVTGLIGSFLSFLEVPVSNAKGDIKECMDSIGWALAKTLLAKLTDSIINWINNGFDGNPFYIGDSGSFFKNIIKDELQFALDDLKRTGNYYFDIMRQEAILSARKTLRGQLGSTLDADIVRGICGYAEYEAEEFCSQQLTPESRYELSRSFTQGYIPFQWSTWDSLTQNCGNNYFCSGTAAINYKLDLQQQRIQNENNTLNRSGGFLNQEVCKDPGFERDLEAWQREVLTYSAPPTDDFVGPVAPDESLVQTQIDDGNFPPKPVCREKIIRTPGRLIADKLTQNLGTTERQLEFADELNESIAAIFDALIGKLIKDGIASFKNNDNDFDDDGNYIGDDDYYRAHFSENNGFDFERGEDILGKNPEACEAGGGTFDEELEVCVFQEDTEAAGPPQFPWTMSDDTVIEDDRDFAAFINTNPDECIQIDELRIKEGIEPCLIGISSNYGDGGDNGDTGDIGDAILTINPSTLLVGSTTTFTINGGPINSIFEVAYRLDDASDLEFLTSGTTDERGSGSAATTTPIIRSGEVTIVVDFDPGILEQTVQVRQ